MPLAGAAVDAWFYADVVVDLSVAGYDLFVGDFDLSVDDFDWFADDAAEIASVVDNAFLQFLSVLVLVFAVKSNMRHGVGVTLENQRDG